MAGEVRHPVRSFMRSVGMIISLGLAAVAVWLVVKGDSTRSIQLGVLAGLWSGLVAGFVLFGSRRVRHLDDDYVERVVQRDASQRRSAEIERTRDVVSRREYEIQLERMLRREIERVMGEQLGKLRSEVTALRNELVEKVGGELRLERIETTRLIGSDLEALQTEIRRLTAMRDVRNGGWSAPSQISGTSAPIVPPSSAPPPTVAPSSPPLSAPPPSAPPRSGPSSAGPMAPEPAQPRPRPVTPAPPTAPPSRQPVNRDPFADLPRVPHSAAPGGDRLHSTPPTPGGRRRRTEDDPNGILARLLKERRNAG